MTHENELLRKENEALRKAFQQMQSIAAGLTNYCEDSASVRKLEREYEDAVKYYTAITQTEKYG